MMRNSQGRFLYPRVLRGSIIIISLWVLVFFAILGVALFKMVSAQIALTKRLESRVIGANLARSALAYARQEREENTPTFDTLQKLKQERSAQLGTDKFIYTLSDEESRININNVSTDVLARLPGLSSALAQSVFNSSLKPYQFKEELSQVDGITDDIFDKCKDFITTYGSGKVNINTASKDVLTALGMDESMAEAVLDFRSGPDGREATDDDGVFENTGEIVDKLRAFIGFSGAQEAALLELISNGALCVNSEDLTVNIETFVAGKSAMRYAVVMGKNKIKQWSQW